MVFFILIADNLFHQKLIVVTKWINFLNGGNYIDIMKMDIFIYFEYMNYLWIKTVCF